MGLFDFLKSKKTNESTESEKVSVDFKSALDEIEKAVYSTLKPIGFKKKGRTFNREVEKGIIQVIHFQSGQYVQNEIPGLKLNLKGKFTINLGVYVATLNQVYYPEDDKTFIKEYECHIRTRLPALSKGQDYWWTIKNSAAEIEKEIIEELKTFGLTWFDKIDSKEKIILNLGQPHYNSSRRDQFDKALMIWSDDKEKGAELINEYYHSLKQNISGHKEFIADIATELGVKIETSPNR